jgi:hypothetical protein
LKNNRYRVSGRGGIQDIKAVVSAKYGLIWDLENSGGEAAKLI